MALYTRKEFAAICRTTTAVVTTNINRGKILLFDKKIDSENKINNAFFNKYNKKAEEEIKKRNAQKDVSENVEELYEKVVKRASSTVVKKKVDAKKERERKKANKEAAETHDWELRKKKADALLQERKAEKEQMQLEKMAGNLIPTELVFNILRNHNQSIFSVFQNDAENLASIWCDILAAGDRSKLAEITEALSLKISKAIERAKEVALSSIDNAVEEYSETRNRGERK